LVLFGMPHQLSAVQRTPAEPEGIPSG